MPDTPEKLREMIVGRRKLPEPSTEILREYGSVGEISCIESRTRQLLNNALMSHAILSMRKVIRWEREINEAKKADRPTLEAELGKAKEEMMADLEAIRVVADRLRDLARCDGHGEV